MKKILFISVLLFSLACSDDDNTSPAENLTDLELSLIDGSPWEFESTHFISVESNEQNLSENEMLQISEDQLNSVSLNFRNNRTVQLSGSNSQISYEFTASNGTMVFTSSGEEIGTLESVEVNQNELSYIDTFTNEDNNSQTTVWKAKLFFVN